MSPPAATCPLLRFRISQHTQALESQTMATMSSHLLHTYSSWDYPKTLIYNFHYRGPSSQYPLSTRLSIQSFSGKVPLKGMYLLQPYTTVKCRLHCATWSIPLPSFQKARELSKNLQATLIREILWFLPQFCLHLRATLMTQPYPLHLPRNPVSSQPANQRLDPSLSL